MTMDASEALRVVQQLLHQHRSLQRLEEVLTVAAKYEQSLAEFEKQQREFNDKRDEFVKQSGEVMNQLRTKRMAAEVAANRRIEELEKLRHDAEVRTENSQVELANALVVAKSKAAAEISNLESVIDQLKKEKTKLESEVDVMKQSREAVREQLKKLVS